MNMINKRWRLRLGRFFLLEKQSEKPSYPFRSVQCTLVDGLKSFFVAYMEVIQCRWIETSVNVVLFLCQFKFRNKVELFLHGFLSLRLLRSKLQELFCRRNSIHN